jgi:hypothetical protein
MYSRTGWSSVLRTCLLVVLGSNLGWVTRYPDFFSFGFPQSLQATVEIMLQLGYERFLPNPVQLVTHEAFYHPTSRSVNTESVVK